MLNKLLKQLLLLLILSLFTGFNPLSAQDVTVTGEVTGAEDGEPLIGVNVMVVGAEDMGTTTDTEGTYQITVPEGHNEISFSYVGYQTQVVSINGREEIDVTLEQAVIAGEEMVVIGYGEAREVDVTAPISTISADDITRNVTTNAMSALQGQVPGMQVTQAGAPGATPEIRVRGIGSMQAADPLYVVDGMFYSDINWLNPHDIESISVLKDASAASIYGVRASGGVIMVETKEGALDQDMVIEYDGYIGINTTSNILPMANTEQYSTMLIEAGVESRLEPSIERWGGQSFTHNGEEYTIPATDTDWYEQLLGPHGGLAPTMNHSLSLRGGGENTTYHVSASYTGEEGLYEDADHLWQRINLRSNLNFMPYDFLDLGASFSVGQERTQDWASVWSAKYYAVPTMPVRNSEQEEDFAGPIEAGYQVGPVNNPAAFLYYSQGNHNYSRTLNLDYNAFAEIRFLGDDRLELRSQFSHSIDRDDSRNYSPRYVIDDKLQNQTSSLSRNFGNSNTMHIDNTLTYRDSYGSHNLTAMGGNNIRIYRSFGMWGSASNVPGEEEHWLYLDNAEDPSPENFDVSDSGDSEMGASFFGRMMYNFDGRYMLNATLRADGTDKYSETWGYFPSLGAAWLVSDEEFMEDQGIFDELRLRASWGQLGNENVPRESGTREITTGTGVSYAFDDQFETGYSPSIFFNELVWELTEEISTGVEISTLDYRLSAEIDWFRKETKEAAIWTQNLMGQGGLVRNQGGFLNTGFEFQVDWHDQIGSLNYNISGNLSTLHNEVLDLGGEPYIQVGTTQPYRSEPGHELYSWYGYKVEGVYQTEEEIEEHLDTDVHSSVKPGFLRFEDVTGDGIIGEEDRQHLGGNHPDFTYGGQISLEYRNLDFSSSFYGVHGNKLFNGLRGFRSHHGDYNFEKDLYENRWTGEGSTDSYPSAEGLFHDWNTNRLSDFLVEDGSYFRIQNVTLGYTIRDLIPGSPTGSKVRFRVTAQNPLTIFSFNGFTPEVGGVGDAGGMNPIPQSFTVGVNITY